ncbi:MAG: PH domain-containing protein [Candidatus Kerfeldbacteria bacterium]|nr:PH domain-containing protein [Candidatus Kerfeldbacteria bacterium]
MLHDQLSKNLKEGETLVKLVRRDLLASLPALIVAAFVVLVDFFLLAFLVRHGTWGLTVFVAGLVAALVIGLRTLVEWRLNALLITNERIMHVHQRGFFNRMVAETTYDRVTDVRSTVKGVLQTALNLGAVEVQTAGEGENLRLTGVRHPPQIQALLTNILRAAKQDTAAPLTAQELVAALTKVKHELGPAAFNDIISRVAPNHDGHHPRPHA